MQNIWEAIKHYYFTLGKEYQVDPGIFLGIHIIATPLFMLAVFWIVQNFKKNKSILMPVVSAILIFNAANIYLVISGKNIPWWIYLILGITTLISGLPAYKKIKKKMKAV